MTTTRPRHSHLRAAALSLAALAAIVTACSSALNRAGTAPVVRETSAPAQAVQADPTKVYFEYQVDAPVQSAPGSSAPRYPAAERAAGIEATVLAQFIVGLDGLVEAGSFRVFNGTTPGDVRRAVLKPESEFGPFEIAVRDAMPTLRYLPAKLKGVPVRGLVQQPFVFAIAKK